MMTWAPSAVACRGGLRWPRPRSRVRVRCGGPGSLSSGWRVRAAARVKRSKAIGGNSGGKPGHWSMTVGAAVGDAGGYRHRVAC